MRNDIILHPSTKSDGFGIPFEYQKNPEYFDAINLNKNSDKINTTIERILDFSKVETVLDLACGTGSQVLFLAKHGYQCTGADFSPDLLQQARSKARTSGQNVLFVDGDMRTLKQGQFDAVITISNAIGHVTQEDFNLTIQNIRDNLRPNGIYIFDIFNLSAIDDDAVTDFAFQTHKKLGKTQILLNQCSTLDKTSGRLISHNSVMIQDYTGTPQVFENTFTLQLYSAKQLENILLANGFHVLTQTNLSGEVLVENKSRSILTVARKMEA